jgi:K(+)-stimulated pyrophosphate-energized sodium pump
MEGPTNPMTQQPSRRGLGFFAGAAFAVVLCLLTFAAPSAHASEADLQLPDLKSVTFMGGIDGRALLMWGLLVCAAGMAFGLYYYQRLRNLPVHRSMLEVSELIYETCKTYLKTQGKFILVLWVFIAAIMVAYFGFLSTPHKPATSDVTAAPGGTVAQVEHMSTPVKVGMILLFSLVGIAGSYAVAWFGIRINTFANSRTAMGSLGGKA